MRNFFGKWPGLTAILLGILLSGAAVWSFYEVYEAAVTGRIYDSPRRSIAIDDHPVRFVRRATMFTVVGFVCSGMSWLTLRTAAQMARDGSLFRKAREPLVPRHWAAPLIDPTKRSNK
ncbi:hypothetical protein GGR88_000922 [Sphingomonas jejuensis]|uniref:Uncharacterized protein n=1 Tax=Sphingomonas jejuensis TaxID=904715 RepID=A0ABX0XJD4_9SPHN|nr:hypothetical protein [Sphingomonas jejuensis]NJC33448.1 hypothetical protein [Sphingomonas jejuensis]